MALRLFGLGLIVLAIAATTSTAFTASNAVTSPKLDQDQLPIGPNSLKPPDCAGIILSNTVIGVNGTSASDLLLGSPADESFRGKNGNDCILAGAGDDTIRGDNGTDVCIGGPGVDSFTTCEVEIQ